jgi:hypothetical protein
MDYLIKGNISYNNSGFNNIGIKIEKEEVVTFNQFFDPRLYHEIKMEMGKDSITNLIIVSSNNFNFNIKLFPSINSTSV